MRGPLIGEKDFQLPLDKKVSSRKGSWRGTKKEEEYLFFWGKKRRNEGVKKRLVLKYERGY
jgi:hypothetical protein